MWGGPIESPAAARGERELVFAVADMIGPGKSFGGEKRRARVSEAAIVRNGEFRSMNCFFFCFFFLESRNSESGRRRERGSDQNGTEMKSLSALFCSPFSGV